MWCGNLQFLNKSQWLTIINYCHLYLEELITNSERKLAKPSDYAIQFGFWGLVGIYYDF